PRAVRIAGRRTTAARCAATPANASSRAEPRTSAGDRRQLRAYERRLPLVGCGEAQQWTDLVYDYYPITAELSFCATKILKTECPLQRQPASVPRIPMIGRLPADCARAARGHAAAAPPSSEMKSRRFN